MQPTPGDVHVNTPLTNVSVAFIQKQENFIAARVFPNIPVAKQSDLYFTYDRGMFNRDEMKERAPGTESQGTGWSINADQNYFCRTWALHHDIPDPVRANADAAINLDREATIFLTTKALIRREKFFVDRFFKTGLWTFDYDGVASAPSGNNKLQWNDAASDPIAEVKTAKRLILQSTGFEPNKLVLGRAVWDVLSEHPDVIDRIKYGQTPGAPAMVTRQAVASLMEIESIEVSNAIENTASEGLATAHSFVAGRHALLCYTAPTPGLMTPTAGYTFSWTGMYGAQADGQRIKMFRMDQLESDRVEIQMSADMKLVSPDLGAFFENIVA